MNAALYTRTGSLEHSTLDQLQRCKEYSFNKGWEVVAVYEDKGISAHELDRKGMKAMMDDAKLHKFDFIVISGYDRLFRSQSFIDTFLNKLFTYNVIVVVVPQL